MPPIRFRIRTIMIAIVVVAVVMAVFTAVMGNTALDAPVSRCLLRLLYDLSLPDLSSDHRFSRRSPVRFGRSIRGFLGQISVATKETGPIRDQGRPPESPGPGRTKAGSPRECRLRLGWKTIDGRRYYFKSEREGGRIQTTSVGPNGFPV